ARLVAHRHAPEPDAERPRRHTACGFEISLCLALEIVAHPAWHVGLITGDTEHMFVSVRLHPHRPARTASMLYAMLAAAQRQHGTVRKRRRCGEPSEPRRDPRAVFLGEFLRLFHAAARRHGEHDFAVRGMNAKRIAPCLP